jgi:hypothetical protein
VYGDTNFMLITMDCVCRKYQNSLRSLTLNINFATTFSGKEMWSDRDACDRPFNTLFGRARRGRVIPYVASFPFRTTSTAMAAVAVAASPVRELTPRQKELKNEADALFRAKEYDDALKKYDCAILIADFTQRDLCAENAVLFSNRAACKQALGQCVRLLLPSI